MAKQDYLKVHNACAQERAEASHTYIEHTAHYIALTPQRTTIEVLQSKALYSSI
jgi:hypothetical protein